MSALEQHASPSLIERRVGERRAGVRLHLDRVLRALIGRNEGVVVDLSLRGARLRHERPLQRGSTVRIAFEWEGERFAAGAEVLASRIITLGTRENEPAIYESRVRFASLTADGLDLLTRIIVSIGDDEVRSRLSNLSASAVSHAPRPSSTPVRGFIRCRFQNRRWQKKWTRDASQPADGFVLPAGTNPSDLEALCRSWEGMDDGARSLVQLTAIAVNEECTETIRFNNAGVT